MPDRTAPPTTDIGAHLAGALRPLPAGAVPAGAMPDIVRALFEQSPLSTVLYDTAGRVVAVNSAFERLFGLTLADIPADYSVLADAQLERAGHLDAVRRAFAGDVVVLPPVRYDAEALASVGRVSWTQGQFFPTRDAHGAVSGVVLVHVDLTARVEAEEARRRDAERLRIALEAGRLGAWEWDIVGGTVHWSDALQRIHGLVPGTFGGTFEEYQRDIHPDDRERVLATIGHSVGGGEHHLEYRIVRPDGAIRWLEARGQLFRDSQGQPERMLGVCMDVTEARLAQEQAETARERLEQQAVELEAQTEQLQQQSADLQAQQAELEQQAEELQVINEELHQANDELAGAEAYLRGVLASISDPFVVQDAEWRFRFVNEAAAAVFAGSGHPDPRALIGRVVWDVYPDLVGGGIEREMRRARDTRTPATFTEFHAASGTWSEMRCYPMPGGGLATLWKDVTGAKRAEEARHYMARASELLAESLDRDETARQLAFLLVPKLADWTSIQLLDEQGELRQVAVAHVDPAKVEWARELNRRYPPDPSQPHGAHEVARTGRPVLLADIPDALLEAVAQDAEHLRIIREIGFTSALTVPLPARGRILGVMTLVSAESGRRYGEAELYLAQELAARAALAFDNAELYAAALRARADAEAANRAKADFLATMSHELRTPLNAIGGYAQLMELGVHGPVTDEQLEALRRVQRSQQHLLSLINDVLNFTKLEAGRVEYELEDVRLVDALADVMTMVEPQIAARGLASHLQVPPRLSVRADREKLQQVLLNLLSNAVKFTSSGSVAVEAAIAADDPSGRVAIRVRDTGIGIPAERLQSVFDPFVQVHRRLTNLTEGTGLGLAISRDLARGMGGELQVASVEGRGSVFTLLLPDAGKAAARDPS